ncbi:unnamed protein product [Colias eurytheme]|nr:unnamed protein product [Colias eurytheme]
MGMECDIIVLSECWLSKVVNLPVMDGYSAHSSLYTNQNDGLVIYVKTILKYTILEPNFSDSNCLILKFSNDLALVTLYRSPSIRKIDPFIESLNKTLDDLKSFSSVVILGDINININSPDNDANTNLYLDSTAFHGLMPAHLFPTRDVSCLDHVMLKTNKNTITLVINSFITDHAPIMLSIEKGKPKLNPLKTVTRSDLDAIVEELLNTDFTHIFENKDPENCSQFLVDTIKSAIDKFTSHIVVSHRKQIIKPWITPGLLRCIRQRDKLQAVWQENPKNLTNEKVFKRYRNFCNNLLKDLKRKYEENLLEKAEGNPRATWNAIKKITSTGGISNYNRDILAIDEDPNMAVNKINHHFVSIGKELATKILVNSFDKPTNNNDNAQNNSQVTQLNSMALLYVDFCEVEDAILSLKCKSAPGWDNIPANIIQRARKALISPIVHTINLCLDKGIFPSVFKKAIVRPIHKGGSRDSILNYRPISILSSLSKIFEKLLHKRLVNYLNKYNIISNNQYGFRRGRSTEDAVLELTNVITRNIENRDKTIAIFLDLAKAFDTVSIPILINKMESVGIRGGALEVFKDYLQNRSQLVKVDE